MGASSLKPKSNNFPFNIFLGPNQLIFPPKQLPCRFSFNLPLFGLGASSKGLGTNLKLSTNKITWIHWSLDLGPSSKVALNGRPFFFPLLLMIVISVRIELFSLNFMKLTFLPFFLCVHTYHIINDTPKKLSVFSKFVATLECNGT
jgi:hypothetical protein